jgi:hypothetical protein
MTGTFEERCSNSWQMDVKQIDISRETTSTWLKPTATIPVNHQHSFNQIINWLVVLTILKIMKVNGKDDIPYIMENKIHVPNHQPVKNHQKLRP